MFLFKMMKATTPTKSLVLRINLIFLALVLIIYAFKPSSSSSSPSSSLYFENPSSFIRCSLRECHHKKVEDGFKMKAVLEAKTRMVKREKPSFVSWMKNENNTSMRIGLVNMKNEDMSEWRVLGETKHINFERVSKNFKWKDLYPEWIDEEEESDSPTCPEIPMPTDYESYGEMDIIVAKLPCRYPEEGWGRDVFRLQVHLITANLMVKNGKRDWRGKSKVVILSECRPMLELFRCDDMLVHEGNWWMFEAQMKSLEQKVSLPVGSCELALPLWEKGNNIEAYNLSKLTTQADQILRTKREAYATVLHSSESYVCGAITLAQSLIQTGTNRDLIMLLDKSISQPKQTALAAAGWKLRIIRRIRNPRAEKDTYNEFNYSKFRLWQLTEYDKIIFIDSDIIVLRNLDILFHYPQMSAIGNDGSIFNSGIMAIEPSNCTFEILMDKRKEIVSYNGGDQGYLNEVFVWWHRLPRRVNYLKNFWANTSIEASLKNQLFESDPPRVYSIHYLGLKPWLCYRDYDCNWNIDDQHVYASDIAHRRWWKLHDSMNVSLQKFCELAPRRKIELDWDRKKASERGSLDGHWRTNILDPRRNIV